MRGLADSYLSVLDLHPEGTEQTIMFVHGYAGVLESWEHQINHFARQLPGGRPRFARAWAERCALYRLHDG